MNAATVVYEKGDKQVRVLLYNDGVRGSVSACDLRGCALSRGFDAHARWYFRVPKKWWSRSMESAVFKAIDFIQTRIEDEMVAEQKLEVVTETLQGLTEALNS